MSASRMKIALFAAASITAAVAASAHAAPLTPIEPTVIEQAAVAVDQDTENAAPAVAVKRIGFAAAATAALAGLFRVLGIKRIKAASAATAAAAGRAATASVKFAASAGKAVVHAAASPFRFAAILGGIGVISLAGVGIYDVEWAGGLVFGALMATAVIIGARRARRAFVVDRSRRR